MFKILQYNLTIVITLDTNVANNACHNGHILFLWQDLQQNLNDSFGN